MKKPEKIAKDLTILIRKSVVEFCDDKKVLKALEAPKHENLVRNNQADLSNQITIDAITMVILLFDAMSAASEPAEIYYSMLIMEMESAFPNMLRLKGSSEEVCLLWKSEIKSRVTAFKQAIEKEFNEEEKRTIAFYHTPIILGYAQLTGEEETPEDELFKLFANWMNEICTKVAKYMAKETSKPLFDFSDFSFPQIFS